MRRSAFLLPLLVLLLGVTIPLSIPSPARAGWPPEGLQVASRGDSVRVVPDGTGGVIVAWINTCTLWVQRLTKSGAELWTPGGILVGDMIPDGHYDVISDGAGGAIVTWVKYPVYSCPPGDIYAQRVDAAGTVLWPAGGVAVCSDSYDQTRPVLTTDGAGGAIIAWEDRRSGTADIYARRVLGDGTVSWTPNGVPVCAYPNDQLLPAVLADGAGGAILGWTDRRSGQEHIYGQRLSPLGLMLWTGEGVLVSPGTAREDSVRIVSDQTGGWILGWVGDVGVGSQRLDGVATKLWGSGGVVLGSPTFNGQYGITCDDNGGLVVTWVGGLLSTLGKLLAQRAYVLDGSLHWGASGLVLGESASHYWPAITANGLGGTIIAWQNYVSSTECTIYALSLDSTGTDLWPTAGGEVVDPGWGSGWTGPHPSIAADGDHGVFLGFGDDPAELHGARVQRMLWSGLDGSFLANINSVADLPEDQGGWVRLDVEAAVADAARHAPGVTGYGVWRQVSAEAASGWAADFGRSHKLGDAQHGVVRRNAAEAAAAGFPSGTWESVGYVPALQDVSYLVASPTRNDSTGAGTADEMYLVTIHTTSPWLYAVSPTATGHSVDNLAPAMLAWFTGQYSAGTAVLHWPVSPEADLAEYRLYAGTTPDFPPDAGHLVVAKPDTGYTHVAGQLLYYKVAAVDRHGNEGPHALTLPTSLIGVEPPGIPERLALYAPAPHPLRGRSVIRFDLPEATGVALRMYDVAGRAVRVLVDGRELPAGRHEWRWSAGEGGWLRPDVYFLRLETRLGTLARKVVVVE